MKKLNRFIIFIFIIVPFCVYGQDSDSIIGNTGYIQEVAEPVSWSPTTNLLYGQSKIVLHSEYGKLYYIVNNTLGNIEPAEYKDGIMLRGEQGRVVDYEILALLERADGRLETYSRKYRVDRSASSSLTKYPTTNMFDRELDYKKSTRVNNPIINVKYKFDSQKYNVAIDNRKVTFPINYENHQNEIFTKDLNVLKGTKPIYMSLIKYDTKMEDNAVIECIQGKPSQAEKPQFGSLKWGETYKNDSIIRIKASNNEDQIYYWINEFKGDGFIFAPPTLDETDKWIAYTKPIHLYSNYNNGTIGLAAFAVGSNGVPSEIAGPYYLKVTNNEVDTKQLFMTEVRDYSRICTINNQKLQPYCITFDSACIGFHDYPKDEQFYIRFADGYTSGRSAYIPCDGEYVFVNEGDKPLELTLYNESGVNFAKVVVVPSQMSLPVVRDFKDYQIHLSETTNVVFYMPKGQIKYVATLNDDKPLIVRKDAQVFRGIFKAEATDGEQNIYRIRFGACDNVGDIVSESNVYTIYVDKKSQNVPIIATGVDFSRYHNDKQTLTLSATNLANANQIYYRINSEQDWKHYSSPINIEPPMTGVYVVKIEAKIVSESGKEYINPQPFEIHFDRRALFVDTTAKADGNGTGKNPYISLDAAIKTAKAKNMKIINVIDNQIDTYIPFVISSDLIIQPYKSDSTLTINMKSHAIERKNITWFTVKNKSLFELRNVSLSIDGGNTFCSIDESKIKFYNTQIKYLGNETFCLMNGTKSMIGANNFSFVAYDLQQGCSLIKADSCQLFMRDAIYTINGKDFSLFDIKDSKDALFDNIKIDVYCDGQFSGIKTTNSNMFIDSAKISVLGGFNTASLFDTTTTDLCIVASKFLINGDNPFKISAMTQNNSSCNIQQCNFNLNKSINAVGFVQNKSDLTFNQSLLDIQNCSEYAYDFRIQDCNVNMNSSIVRAYKCDSSVNITLTNGAFVGVNNSIFNCKSNSSEFNFWVTNKADITSINSLYYCDNKEKDNALIYVNNGRDIKPLLYSNVLSSNVSLMQRYDNKNMADFETKFLEKNIFYDFASDFDFDNENGFFVPARDSVLLQGGLDSNHSSLPIPEYDYFGNLRENNRSGIDIGAVQRSGWF